MSSKPILYSYYGSSCAWRVRTALALKGVEYIYKTINLNKEGGEQFTSEFEKINPLRQVPVLVINNQVLAESLAIIEYIDEVYNTGVPLLPKDPLLKAKVREIAQVIVSGIQPLQNTSTLIKIEKINPEDHGLRKNWAIYWVTTKFEGLEKLLSETSGKCCVGDDISIADLCLVPQIRNALIFGVDMKLFPMMSKINEYLLTMDAFKRTHPSQQPDYPQQ